MPDKAFDPIPTRHSLLSRLKDWGDQASWQEFFDTYWRLIYNVATKAGLSDAEAQEVVQETVIAVARKIAEFKTDPAHGSFSAWLMQLTRWRIADQFRRRGKIGGPDAAFPMHGHSAKRQVQTDDTGTTDAICRVADPAGVPLESLWQEEWDSHVMAVALERVKCLVSPGQYQMFDLHVLQKLSVQDTARTVRATRASVYMARYRISRLLRKQVAELLRQL